MLRIRYLSVYASVQYSSELQRVDSTQSLNQTACCQSTVCCGMYVWDTCYHEECHTDSHGVQTCDEEAYQCNYHCSYWNPVEQCLGHCGTCMDSTIIIYSHQFNQSSTIQTHCNLDDFSCEKKQSNFTVNSTWPCYYGGGQTLILQVPAPDKLIGLWWFLGGVFGLANLSVASPLECQCQCQSSNQSYSLE
jgi:hypothetical protein